MYKQQYTSSNHKTQQLNAKTTIGMINNIKTLDCHISLSPQYHTHKFTVNYKPLNIFSLLFKRRLTIAFQKIASMTYQLKIKQSNIFIPQALLNGDTNVIHQYKKLLEKAKIQSYIKLNIRKEEISRQKKTRAVSVKEKDTKSSLQQLYNKKMVIADNNYFHNDTNKNSIINQINKNSQIYEINKNSIINDNFQSHQTTVRKLNNSRQQKQSQEKQTQSPLFKSTIFKPYVVQSNQNYLQIPSQFRQQIHHHHSFYHHKKTKKSSKSVANKSQKNNPFQGIKINYYEVKSNTKENPQMATFIYPNMGLLNNKSGPKSVKQKVDNNKSIRQHSTIKTQIMDIQNVQKNIAFQSPSKKHIYVNNNYQQNNKRSPNYNQVELDKFSIRSHIINKPQLSENKMKINNSLHIDDDFQNDQKQFNSYLLGDQITGGKTLMIGHQRNIVKKKNKITTTNNKDWMGGFQMNMV